MKIFENKNKIIEIGFSRFSENGNYGAFKIKEINLLYFYIRTITPTLSYMSQKLKKQKYITAYED